MKRITLLSLLFISIISFSQENVTNSEGDKITLFKNGTWEKLDTISNNENNSNQFDVEKNPSICNKFVEYIQDPMTNHVIRSMKETIVLSKDNKTGFTIDVSEVNRSPFISFKSIDSNCVNKYNNVLIVFKDGKRITLSNVLEYNCKGQSTAYFGEKYNKFDKMEQLAENQIKTIRFFTAKSYIQEDMSDDQSLRMMTVLNCLYKGLPR